MKVKPVKNQKNIFKEMGVVEMDCREAKDSNGATLVSFPKSTQYTIIVSDDVPKFQWIGIGGNFYRVVE